MTNNSSEGALVAGGQSAPLGVVSVHNQGGREALANVAGEPLVVDAPAHEVILGGQLISMTAKEFALLHYLYEHRGVVFSRAELLRDVWGQAYRGGPRTVDIHVRRLRIKLGSEWIETIRQVGYKFRAAVRTPVSVR